MNDSAVPSQEIGVAPTDLPEISLPEPNPAKTDFKEQAHIEYIQRRLNDLGCAAGAEDGVLGNQSRNALRRFAAAIGIEYFDGIIFEMSFLKQLEIASGVVCPPAWNVPTPRNKGESTPIPLKIATHWEMSCNAHDGQSIHKFFARVVSYSSGTGEVSFVIRNDNGSERSMHGSIGNGVISIFDQHGTFNASYTQFTISDSDCPGGIYALALY